MMSMKKKKTECEEAWSWAIEALASYKQIDTALLDDLVSKSPCDYGSLSTTARERISLRALEELLPSTTNGAKTTNPTPTSSCIVFNVAEPAQDVLHHLHQKIKASSSGVAVLDSYKMELHQFILQKRARLPKCALQQLEDALIKGDHPSIKFLREESGLNKTLHEEPARELNETTNGIRNWISNANSTRLVSGNLDKLLQKVPLANPSSSTRKKGRKVQFVDGGDTVNRVSDASKHSRKTGEFDEVNEITSPLAPEKVMEIVQDGPPNDVVPGKRKRSEFTEEHLEDCLVSGEPMATEHDTDLPREPLRSLHARRSSSIQDEGTDMEQGTQAQDLLGNREPVDGFGDYEHVVSKRSKRSLDDVHTEPYLSTFISSNDNLCHEAEAEPEPDAFVDDTESGSENQTNSEPSHGNGANCDEMVENSTMKGCLPTSKRTLSRDPQETNWTEDMSCLKCNKGDELLICFGSTCQIAVHESCLGSSANVDDAGNFYCPFCSYLQAIAAYRETKEKFVRAKEKVELAKNCLSKFVNVEHEARQKQASMGRVESGNVGEEMNASGRQKEQVTDEAIADLGTTKSDLLPPQQDNRLKGSCPPEGAALTDKGLADVGATNADEPHRHADSPSPPVDQNVEETTCDAKFEFRRRKLPVKPPSNSRVGCRRRPTPWSCEEEEKLKEGLDKYGDADAKWKKILEFGRNVFHESRTAIDLKDKWRNMDWSKFSKAGPRPRRSRRD